MSFFADWNRSRYTAALEDLNRVLREIEVRDGLGAALAALEAQQLDLGFIQDELREVVRYRLADSLAPARFFTAQVNPRRAKRFEGAGRITPPHGVHWVHGGCALCPENIRLQQRQIQFPMEISTAHGRYHALASPFPLMPAHFTMAAAEHSPQSWMDGDDGLALSSFGRVVGDLLELAGRLPGFVGWHSDVGAGATIAQHFHFQICRRPDGYTEFPLERAAREACDGVSGVPVRDYPVAVLYFRGSRETVVAEAGAWVARWLKHCAHMRQSLSANLIAMADTSDRNVFHFYFAPRNRLFPFVPGLKGQPASLEILGELVFTSDAERAHLEEGAVDFQHVSRVLQAIDGPGVERGVLA